MLPHGGHSIFQNFQEHFEGIQKALTKEVKEMSDAFDELEAELDQSVVDRKHDEIERKNLLIEHDNIIADGDDDGGGGGVGCGGTAAGEEGRVRESDLGDWVDQGRCGTHFCVAIGKSRWEKFLRRR
ncbi:hypothetical protein Tco_0059761 [Tanacetum coccineum]